MYIRPVDGLPMVNLAWQGRTAGHLGEMSLPQYTNTSTAAVCAVFPANTGRLEIPLNISIDKDNKRIKKSKLTTMLDRNKALDSLLGHITREHERFSFTLVRSRCFSDLHHSGCHNHHPSNSCSQHIWRPCVHWGCYYHFGADFQGHISVFDEQTAEAKGREAQAR